LDKMTDTRCANVQMQKIGQCTHTVRRVHLRPPSSQITQIHKCTYVSPMFGQGDNTQDKAGNSMGNKGEIKCIHLQDCV
jgi:hypothetical protein